MIMTDSHTETPGRETEESLELALREAQRQFANDEAGPEKVREAEEALALSRHRRAGLEETRRIEAEEAAEAERRLDRERREQAVETARNLIDGRLKLTRRMASAVKQLASCYANAQEFDRELFNLIRPYLKAEQLTPLRDALTFPARDEDLILRELAAAGVPVAGISMPQAASFIEQHDFLQCAVRRAAQMREGIMAVLPKDPSA